MSLFSNEKKTLFIGKSPFNPSPICPKMPPALPDPKRIRGAPVFVFFSALRPENLVPVGRILDISLQRGQYQTVTSFE